MKKFLLASVAALGIVAAGAASAADLPSRKGPVEAPIYVPVFTWTGFYVGVNAGYAWGQVEFDRSRRDRRRVRRVRQLR